MLCDIANCKELDSGGFCKKYTKEYMKFVTRRNYCPFINYPPVEHLKEEVVRLGQQKQRKSK